MDLKLSFAMEHSPRAFILASVETKRLLFWNKIAEKLYGIDENTKSLEGIFTNCEMSLHDMTMKMMKDHSPEKMVSSFPDLFTITHQGDEQLVDLVMGFMTEDLDEVFFELTPKADLREEFALKMVDESVKPMFLADFSEELTIYHGNEIFYKTFTKGKEAFEKFYHNSFAKTMEMENNGTLWQDVIRTLQTQVEFHRDIQVSTVHGVKKWYLLELQCLPIGNGVKKLRGMLFPIGDRVAVANELENMNRYLSAIQELTHGALFYLNPSSKKVEHHSKRLKKFGFPEEMEQFPQSVLPMIHPEDQGVFEEYIEKTLEGYIEPQKIRYSVGKDMYSWAKFNTMPIYDDQENIVEIVGKIENIDAEMNLLERVTTDPLTNALNKEFVQEEVMKIVAESVPDAHHALFFLDMDDFKYVNDNLGHQFGDFVLKELGKRMFSCIRDNDLIGRVGGDEFIIFIRNIPNFEMLKNRARRLLDTISQPIEDGTHSHTMGCSVGISVFPDHGSNYEELYHHADLALYRSKDRGKNMATIYKPS